MLIKKSFSRLFQKITMFVLLGSALCSPLSNPTWGMEEDKSEHRIQRSISSGNRQEQNAQNSIWELVLRPSQNILNYVVELVWPPFSKEREEQKSTPSTQFIPASQLYPLLPEELWQDILNRLPLQDQLQFLFVSTDGGKILSTVSNITLLPNFQENHLPSLFKRVTPLYVNLNNCTLLVRKGIHHLSTLTKIQKLNLSQTYIGPKICFISTLTNITELDLEGGALDTKSISYLSGLTKIQKLNLSAQMIVDNDLSYLSNLTNMRALNLQSCSGIGWGECPYLSTFINMQYLNLGGCCISDKGILRLSLLTNLQTLILGSCTGITNEGYKRLSNLTNLKSRR